MLLTNLPAFRDVVTKRHMPCSKNTNKGTYEILQW